MPCPEPSDLSPHNWHNPELEVLLNQTRPDPIDDDRLARILDQVEALCRRQDSNPPQPQDLFAALAADDEPANLDELLDAADLQPLPEQRVEKILRAVLEQIHKPSDSVYDSAEPIDEHHYESTDQPKLPLSSVVDVRDRSDVLAEAHRRTTNHLPPQGPSLRAPWHWLTRHRQSLCIAATIAVLLPLSALMLISSPQPVAMNTSDPSMQTDHFISVDPQRGSRRGSTQQTSMVSFICASNAAHQPATAQGWLDWNPATRSGQFIATGLLASKPNQVYLVWLHPRDGQPVSLAQFPVTDRDPQIRLSLSLPSDSPNDESGDLFTQANPPVLITVTDQPADASPNPSAPVQLLGRPTIP